MNDIKSNSFFKRFFDLFGINHILENSKFGHLGNLIKIKYQRY
jgi:hypothetical protein